MRVNGIIGLGNYSPYVQNGEKMKNLKTIIKLLLGLPGQIAGWINKIVISGTEGWREGGPKANRMICFWASLISLLFVVVLIFPASMGSLTAAYWALGSAVVFAVSWITFMRIDHSMW